MHSHGEGQHAQNDGAVVTYPLRLFPGDQFWGRGGPPPLALVRNDDVVALYTLIRPPEPA